MMLETVNTIKRAALLLIAFSFICGIIYPAAVTALSWIVFPKQAGGSLVFKGEVVVGSELIGQKFNQPKYFHGRPSAVDYATIPSGASNQGPTSQALKDAIIERQKQYSESMTSDLLTTSGSGLDPHISPEAAYLQVQRILSEKALENSESDRIRLIIARNTENSTFGFLGKKRVNVLKLNIALDQELP